MLETTKNGYSANKVFFLAWITLMRVTCLLFLIIQSQVLGPNFTVYCIAVICLAKPVLSNIEKFKRSEKDTKKLLIWLAFVSTTSSVAFIWGYISNSESASDAALAFLIKAAEATAIILLVHAVIVMSKLFAKWRSKREYKNKIKNQSNP